MSAAEIYCCSTLLSAVTAVVAGDADLRLADAGSTPGGGGGSVRRFLLLADYALEAEVGVPLSQRPGTTGLTELFDVVVDVNELIAPYHPGGWTPGEQALELLGRLLRERWQIDAEVSLFVEPYQMNFAHWMLDLFPEATVTVVADGLMAYGPTRRRVPARHARRVVELAHLDLVPGLVPVYLSEHRVPSRALSAHRVRTVIDRLRAPELAAATPAGVLVLGQYLSAVGIMSEAEEERLYVDAIVNAAQTAGSAGVSFKPHPAASPLHAQGVQRAASERGVSVELVEAGGPAELLFAAGRYGAVHGCFSTGLFTASRLYGLPALAFGTSLLLERLTPYSNSNRIPVTITDLLLRVAGPGAAQPVSAAEVEAGAGVAGTLVRAVSYCMQAKLYPELRSETIDTLTGYPHWRERYVKRGRLTRLGLPGGAGTVPPPEPTIPGRLATHARRLRRRAGRAARRAGQVLIDGRPPS